MDLLFSCSGADTINAGLDLVDAGTINDHTYYRNGYGKLQFDCSQFPTDSEKVRQALLTAWTATSLPVSTPAATLPLSMPLTAWLSGSIRSPSTGSTRT